MVHVLAERRSQTWRCLSLSFSWLLRNPFHSCQPHRAS